MVLLLTPGCFSFSKNPLVWFLPAFFKPPSQTKVAVFSIATLIWWFTQKLLVLFTTCCLFSVVLHVFITRVHATSSATKSGTFSNLHLHSAVLPTQGGSGSGCFITANCLIKCCHWVHWATMFRYKIKEEPEKRCWASTHGVNHAEIILHSLSFPPPTKFQNHGCCSSKLRKPQKPQHTAKRLKGWMKRSVTVRQTNARNVAHTSGYAEMREKWQPLSSEEQIRFHRWCIYRYFMQHNASPCTPSPTSPLSDPTHMQTQDPSWFFFFFLSKYDYLFSNRAKRKPAGRVAANLVGAVEKKRGYRLHKRPEWNVSRPDRTANRNVPWCERWVKEKRSGIETELAFNVNNVDPTSFLPGLGKKRGANLYQTHVFSHYFANSCVPMPDCVQKDHNKCHFGMSAKGPSILCR